MGEASPQVQGSSGPKLNVNSSAKRTIIENKQKPQQKPDVTIPWKWD